MFSSEEIGREESAKTSGALKEIERKLFEQTADDTVTAPAFVEELLDTVAIVESSDPEEEEIRRFQQFYRKDFDCSDGAAGSSLNDKEIDAWKNTFPYIRVCSAMSLPSTTSDANEPFPSSTHVGLTIENYAEEYFQHSDSLEDVLKIRRASIMMIHKSDNVNFIKKTENGEEEEEEEEARAILFRGTIGVFKVVPLVVPKVVSITFP